MKLQQPIWPRFLPTHVVLNLARLGPVGARLPAPGTWGSVAGLLYFTVFFYPLGTVATVLLSTLACLPACSRTPLASYMTCTAVRRRPRRGGGR